MAQYYTIQIIFVKGEAVVDYHQRRKLQGQETEQRILRSALALMREYGYEKVSVRDICQQAGITTGAFYHHFPSKETMIARGFGALDSYMKQALEGREQEPPAQRLRRILTTYADFMERESGELTARYYLIRLSNVKAGIRLDPTHYINQAMVDCFEQARARGEFYSDRSPQWTAEFCYRHFRGVVLDWLLSGFSYSLRQRMLEDYDAFLAFFAEKTPKSP